MSLKQVLEQEWEELDWNQNKWAVLFGIIAISPTIGIIPDTQILYYIILFVVFLWQLKTGASLNRLMVGFLLACAVSIVLAQPNGLFHSWSRYFVFLLVIAVASPLIQGDQYRRFRLVALMTMIKLCVLVGIISFVFFFAGINYMKDIYETGYHSNLSLFGGLTRHSMLLSPMSGIAALYCVYKALSKKNPWYWLFAFPCVGCVMLASSRAALLSTIVGVLISSYAFTKGFSQYIKIILGIGLAALLCFSLWDTALEGLKEKHLASIKLGSYTATRDSKWENRIVEFRSSPVYGVGFAACDLSHKSDYNLKNGGVEPGSSWLCILSMTGLLGFVPFFIIMYRSCLSVWHRLQDAILLSGLLAFLSAHMLAEGYIVAGGNPFCIIAWLIIACSYDVDFIADEPETT